MLFRTNYGFNEWNREDSLDNRRSYTATKWGLLLCVPYYSRWLWKGRKGCQAISAGDYKTALNLWTPMARKGDAEAQYRLGMLTEQGAGVLKNVDQAARLYARAAGQGHWRALWRIKRAAKEGSAVAQYCLGQYFNNGFADNRDERQAQQWFERAATQGLAEAQVELGRTYLPPSSSWGFIGQFLTRIFGQWHGPKRDVACAIEWFRTAADQGNADGSFQLGLLFLLGHYVEQDVKTGLQLMEDAAAKGLGHAQISLAVIYSEGEYITPDPARATYWFQKGEAHISKENEAETLVCLGIAFREGWGTGPNKVLAYKWFKLAEHKDRKRFRAMFGPLVKDLKKTMSKGEINQAIGLIEMAHNEEMAFI